VGDSDKSRLISCVCGRLSGKQHQMSCISQGSAATLLRRGERVNNFLHVSHFLRINYVHQTLLKSVNFSPIYSKYTAGAFF